MPTSSFADKATAHFRNVLAQAFQHAKLHGTSLVTPLHLLIALLNERGSIGEEILRRAGVTRDMLVPFFDEVAVEIFDGDTALSPASKRIIERAVFAAAQGGHAYIGTEHLVAAFLDVAPKEFTFLFDLAKVKRNMVEQQLDIAMKSAAKISDLFQSFRTKEKSAKQVAKQKTPALDFFGVELTDPKIAAALDPIVGRDEETERLVHILCRRTKNNPLLLGDPGVGKTAIVEGLAKRIVEGTVPATLLDKRIFAIDLGLMIAGTMYRGEFEGRIKQLIDEVKVHPEIILFIDEVHSIVGAGSSNGTLDAANLLKPALARGELHVIGATTFDEFKKHIEHDAALERRFQPVQVKEPSAEETILMLENVKHRYEQFHHISLASDALSAAVQLAAKYFPEKHFPDKAIDLLDEAMSAIKVQNTHMEGFAKEAELKKTIVQLMRKKQEAVTAENFETAADTQAEEQKKFNELIALRASHREAGPVGTVTAQDIFAVLSRILHRPLADMSRGIHSRDLSATLQQKIFGQTEALTHIAATLAKAELGLSHDSRPLASFLFVGPTGTGKSEVAKLIATAAYGDPKAVIHFDMTEFSEGFSISKMLGSPAGYIGHKEGVTLVDRLRRQPLSVIVFDEIDKAHPDVLNILLHMLEEGRLTDATGKEANIKQCMIILTYQIPFEESVGSSLGFGGGAEKRTSADIKESLRKIIKPELLNRIDTVCVFQPLSPEALAQIATAELTDLAARVAKQHIVLTWEDTVPQALVKTIDSARDGARSVRHATARAIEQPLIEAFMSEDGLHTYHMADENGILRGIPTYGRRRPLRGPITRVTKRERASARA